MKTLRTLLMAAATVAAISGPALAKERAAPQADPALDALVADVRRVVDTVKASYPDGDFARLAPRRIRQSRVAVEPAFPFWEKRRGFALRINGQFTVGQCASVLAAVPEAVEVEHAKGHYSIVDANNDDAYSKGGCGWIGRGKSSDGLTLFVRS